MGRVAKFKVFRNREEIGEFLYFQRLGLTLFRSPQGELEKPRLSFRELYKLYKQAGYDVQESFNPIDRLFIEGRITI